MHSGPWKPQKVGQRLSGGGFGRKVNSYKQTTVG
jgi:hypothetical protein